MMTSRKKLGGPKTEEGKLRSSKNATKHGLSTMKASDDNEQVLIDQFSQELNRFYKPASPLETFQIQRIAICRAKLARLYEVESVRLQLAKNALSRDQSKILEQLAGVNDLTKGMLSEYLQFGQCTLPCGLDEKVLEDIASEILRFSGKITNEHQFIRSFPALTRYLRSLMEGKSEEQSDLGSKLVEVGGRLEGVFKKGSQYHEFLRPLLQELSSLKRKKEDLESKEFEREIEEYNARRTLERQALYPSYQQKKDKSSTAPQIVPTIFEKHDELFSQLEWFSQLWEAYRGLENALAQYQDLERLLLRAVTLPTQDSDLFMRYQTTLERRLSGAIGELLELQKYSRSLNVNNRG